MYSMKNQPSKNIKIIVYLPIVIIGLAKIICPDILQPKQNIVGKKN